MDVELLQYFCCFECNHLFAIARVKGRSKHVSSVVAAASIAIAPLATFTPSRHAKTRRGNFLRMPNGRVFIQSWRWDPPKLSRKIPSFSQNGFGKFLRGGYPNRNSGIHRWGLDLSTGYPNTYFSWFSGYPQLTLVFLPGDEKFRIFFPEVPVTKIRVSAPAPYKNPTVIA